MPKVKLTVHSVERTAASSRDTILWDTEVPGFGCKVTPAGTRVYFLYYRTAAGQQRKPRIGLHGALKPEQARAIARGWLGEVLTGRDPSGDRSASRVAPTVKELSERYLEEHARTRKRSRSVAEDERLIAKRILPFCGQMKVGAVREADIAALHHSLRETPYEANRVLALLSKMFNLAETWGLRPRKTNPTAGARRYAERKRERFLLPLEIRRLLVALAEEEGQAAIASVVPAIRLLLATGCRLSEVLKLRWRDVDLAAGKLRLPDSKTGAKDIYLGPFAQRLLMELAGEAPDQRSGDDYVFPGRRRDKPLNNLQKPWRRIRARAGLHDVRLHDLRHTYASLGVAAGLSLHAVGKLLGHAQAATTHRYAHLADDPMRQSAGVVDAQLMLAMGITSNGPH